MQGTSFHLHCLKEPDYALSLMSVRGTMERMGKPKRWHENGTACEFQYSEVVHNHCAYCDAVDNHNKCRMHPIATEESAKTTHWASRVFNFIIAVTKVNTRLTSSRVFNHPEMSQIKFWLKLAKELMHNPHSECNEAAWQISL